MSISRIAALLAERDLNKRVQFAKKSCVCKKESFSRCIAPLVVSVGVVCKKSSVCKKKKIQTHGSFGSLWVCVWV